MHKHRPRPGVSKRPLADNPDLGILAGDLLRLDASHTVGQTGVFTKDTHYIPS